ncbi:MAG: TlpA family protein disulfide reductase [Bacteroidales bacterium]|nr:TlpA family protein disulfide reductase [Bacteroidales bacterium]
MKRYLFILATLLLAACKPSSQEIEIEIEAKNPSEKMVMLVYHKTLCPIDLDDSGYGKCTLHGMDAVYAKVFYGMASKNIYLEKGDRVKISFDAKDFAGTFTFDGDKAPAVGYLNAVTLAEFQPEKFALPFDEFQTMLTEMENNAVKILDAHDMRGTGKFRKMEKGRIRYSYACPLLVYPVGHELMTQEHFETDGTYYGTIRRYAVEDNDLVDIDQYREFMSEAAHQLDINGRDIKEMYPKTVASMRYIADNSKSTKVRENLLHHIAAPYVEIYGTDNIQELSNIYTTYVKDTSLIADFRQKCDIWDYTKPGKKAPEFTAVDIEGNKHHLREFRGKYVYIDIWATWCAPCRAELPYLKELEAKFKGRNIVFLGLSIDQDKTKWEEKVKGGELCGEQFYLGLESDFQKRFKINGIPRFILLDMEGKTINSDMTRPSSAETVSTLENLENI